MAGSVQNVKPVQNCKFPAVVCVDALGPSQQFFSHVGTPLIEYPPAGAILLK